MGYKKGSMVAVTLILAAFMTGCISHTPGVTIIPTGRDRDGCPLASRKGPPPTAAMTAREFYSLQRPIIIIYRPLEPQLDEGMPSYQWFALTKEAYQFINSHTFDELAVALGPLLHDSRWSGDMVAILTVAASSPWESGTELAASGYRSPDNPGKWPQQAKAFTARWSVTCIGATWAIRNGSLVCKTPAELESDRRYLERVARFSQGASCR